MKNNFKQLIVELWLSCLLLSGVTLFAQENSSDIQVYAHVSTKSFFIGKEFIYSILVNGSDEVTAPQLPKLTAFSIKKIDEQSLEKGNLKTYSIRYKVIPIEAGDLRIPPIKLTVAGHEHSTQAISIKIEKARDFPGLLLDAHLSQKTAYVGEPILLTITWYSSLPLYGFKAINLRVPLLEHQAFGNMDALDSPTPGEQHTIALPVSSNRVITKRGHRNIDGENYEYLRFRKVVIPRYAGEFSLDPAFLLCAYVHPQKSKRRRNWAPIYPSFYNNEFFETKISWAI